MEREEKYRIQGEEVLRLQACKKLCMLKIFNYQKCLQETIPKCMNDKNYFLSDSENLK